MVNNFCCHHCLLIGVKMWESGGHMQLIWAMMSCGSVSLFFGPLAGVDCLCLLSLLPCPPSSPFVFESFLLTTLLPCSFSSLLVPLNPSRSSSPSLYPSTRKERSKTEKRERFARPFGDGQIRTELSPESALEGLSRVDTYRGKVPKSPRLNTSSNPKILRNKKPLTMMILVEEAHF